MAKDPLTLTESDILQIIEAFRLQRKAWAQAEAAGATKAPRGASAGPKIAVPANLSADDLGL